MSVSSTTPYFIRAIFEWCADNGLTPYLAVAVSEFTMVPMEHVKDGEITLNISPRATGGLTIGNEAISFSARFNGAQRDIYVPINRVRAIFAREDGTGMTFDISDDLPHNPPPSPVSEISRPKSGRPQLKVVK